MIKQIYLVLVILSLANLSASAESYVRDYTYKASDADSKITSRTNALDQVKLILLQEIGTHIRQKINITKDGSGNSYASEDVEAITAGLTKVEIIEEKWDGETYYLKAIIYADTESVLNALSEFKNEKTERNEKQVEVLKAHQRMLSKSREEIMQLKQQLKEVKSKKHKDEIVIKYIEQVNKQSTYLNKKAVDCTSTKSGLYCKGCVDAGNDSSVCKSASGNCGSCYLNACLHSPKYSNTYNKSCPL